MDFDATLFHATFFDEAHDHVRVLEERLLALETTPTDDELLNELFRAAHSIKGSAGLLGFDHIARLTHAMENLLDAMREGAVVAGATHIKVLLEAADLLGALLVVARAGEGEVPDLGPCIEALGLACGQGAAPPPPPAAAKVEPLGLVTRTVRFFPGQEVFARGLDPSGLLRELAELGQASAVQALTEHLPPFEEFDPERCYLGWSLEVATARSEADFREVFTFIDDLAEVQLGVRGPAPEAGPVQGAPGEPVTVPPPAPRASSSAAAPADSATLRVSTAKVDRLINLVGELVIAQAMIARQLSGKVDVVQLRESVADMERHIRELQDRVLNIRMIPIGTIFGRFRRLVHDLSESLGKGIDLQLVGEETELDKSMVEHLADPLMHLVRNAADHGLERPEDRLAAGKPPTGTITLSARHQGGNVVIDITDDGAGLSTARIRAKAVEKGLIAHDTILPDEQVWELIFAPGFSTAEAVTDLSGRGVGLDVVKRSVEALNGQITIASQPGQGSRIRLSLPLTLAILDGMALRVGQATFVLPLNQVVETLNLKHAKVKQLLTQGEMLLVRGEPLPLVRLSHALQVPQDAENKRPLGVVVEAGDTRFALAVDELLGQSQFVIKSLEPNFQKLEGVLGATILGDGTVSLILDVPALARLGNIRSAGGSDGQGFTLQSQAQEAHA